MEREITQKKSQAWLITENGEPMRFCESKGIWINYSDSNCKYCEFSRYRTVEMTNGVETVRERVLCCDCSL